MPTLLILDATLVTATETTVVDVLVREGAIDRIAFHDAPTYAVPSVPDDEVHEVMDGGGLLLFPGLIDCHVHFREPGLTEKGDMESESAAARAGGVGTVCDMPNTVPPTVSIDALRDKVRRAERIRGCDIRFFFGVTDAMHVQELEALWRAETEELKHLRNRCCGVKIYFDHSTGNQRAAADVIREVFCVCGELSIPIVAHCEDSKTNRDAAARVGSTDVSAHSLRRPPESEERAIAAAIDLARTFGTRLHVAHLSTRQGTNLVRRAKREGLPVTCEAAPHHLFLTVEDYASLATLAKMNPPLRTRDHQKALWEGIGDGTIDCIATDHAPHTLGEKREVHSSDAPSGVPGVETMLPLLLSVAGGWWPDAGRRQRSEVRLQIPDIVRLCFENPNRIFHLGKRGIAEGLAAELVLVDPKQEWTIRGSELASTCGWTPYEGWKVRGKVVRFV